MLNIGMTELLVFGIIALLILGPDKLPEAARFMGKWYSRIKRTIHHVHQDIDRELRLSELRAQMQEEMQRIQALEIKMKNQLNELEQYKLLEAAEINDHRTYHFMGYPLNYVFRPAYYRSGLSRCVMISPGEQQLSNPHFNHRDLGNKNYQAAL